ncbi:ATP-binding cassette domain-containing protein [Nonomuraea sp. NPDC049758]|uniref:ABC transporter ATP-binding protein n=1 Tax=Nonomuraea sp. NPDC049758 TaxID=3154360 RepID=UPI00342030FE
MRLLQVSFRYRRRQPFVLEEADAQLAPGDAIELTGANGAGKSTLLRLLAGLARPTRGHITDRPGVVGFAPDRFPTAQPFTVTSYLTHMASVRGGARWRPWAERLNMGHLLGLPLGELSKGSAHKVGLVQALMADPGLLILDEPFAGLDADTRETLPAIVTEVAGRGGIVITSDHQGGLRGLPGLRSWLLVDGHLKESTPAAAVAQAAQVASVIPATHAPKRPLTTVAVTLPADDLPLFLTRMRDQGYRTSELDHPHTPEEPG